MTEQRHTADTITDDALDALYEELAAFKAQLLLDQQRITRVRALIDRDHDGLCCSHVTGQIRRTLDTPEH